MFHKRIRVWHKKNERMYKVTSIDFEDEFVELDTFIGGADEGESIVANFDEVVIKIRRNNGKAPEVETAQKRIIEAEYKESPDS